MPKMMRIVTINFNGVRAAWRKGFLEWLQAAADIVCAQELGSITKSAIDFRRSAFRARAKKSHSRKREWDFFH